MIYVQVIRLGVCEMCGGRMIMLTNDHTPTACEFCHSPHWQYGRESIESTRIRTGMTFANRKLDGRRDRRKQEGAGAKSLKRRERARRQWKSLKPKEVLDSAPQA